MPDVPTIAESVPGYDLRSWYGLLAPNGTPAAVVLTLNREVSAVINAPEMKTRLEADGAEASAPNTPAEFRDLILAETARWSKIINSLGLGKKEGAK